jgi:S1-C subfamily serine protease
MCDDAYQLPCICRKATSARGIIASATRQRHSSRMRAAAPVALISLALAVLTSRADAQPSHASEAPEVADHSERITRATVAILAGTSVRERGVVIADDGRIVTALGPIRADTQLTVRYANGRTAPVTVAASDAVWGLALLEPRTGRWAQGLPLAASARGNTPVRWTVGDQPRSLATTLHRRHTYVGPHSELLRDAWDFDPQPPDNSIGSGVANAAGELVAVVVAPEDGVGAGGAPANFGVPAPVIHDLLTRTAMNPRPWLGLVARNPRAEDTAARTLQGLAITDVAASGPADRAGIHGGRDGDVIIGTPQRPIRTVEDLAGVLEHLHPGDSVTLRVVRAGTMFEIPIQLGDFPAIEP